MRVTARGFVVSLLVLAGSIPARAQAPGFSNLNAPAAQVRLGLASGAGALTGTKAEAWQDAVKAVMDVQGAPVDAQPASDPVLLAPVEVVKTGASVPVKEIDLAALLNRHLKTSLQYTLSGAGIWVSGLFGRDQSAFVSIVETGKAVRVYNVKDLLGSAQSVAIGSGDYRLSLSPDLSDNLESEIVLTNKANKKDQVRITLRELIAACSAAGDRLDLPGQTYNVFYYDDPKGGGQDPSKKTIVFLLTDAKGEFHIFMVPAELVVAGKITVFKMHNDHRVGLQRRGDTLVVFDNP